MPADFLSDEEMDRLAPKAETGPAEFLSDEEMEARSTPTTNVDPAVKAEAVERARALNLTPEQREAFEGALRAAPQEDRKYVPDAPEGAPKRLPEGYVDSGTAAVRGLRKGASFGFADELAGVRSALTGGTYREGRDAARLADQKAEEAHPEFMTGGEAIGALAAPTPGAAQAARLIKPAAGLTKGALTGAARGGLVGALSGGLYGAGQSEADLTEDETEGFLTDLLTGAGSGAAGGTVLGGAAGGLSGRGAARAAALRNSADKARELEDSAALQMHRVGVEAPSQQKLAGGPEAAARKARDVVNDPRLAPSIDLPPAEALPLIREVKDEAGAALGAVRDQLSRVPAARVPAADLRARMAVAMDDLPMEARRPAMETVQRIVSTVEEDGHVGAIGLRELIKEAERGSRFDSASAGVAGATVPSSAWRQVRRQLVDLEKQLVAQHLPDISDGYLRNLAQYSRALTAEAGKEGRLAQLQAGANVTPGRGLESQLRTLESEADTTVGTLPRLGGAVGALAGHAVGGGPSQIAFREVGYNLARILAKRPDGPARTDMGAVAKELEALAARSESFRPLYDRAAAIGPAALVALGRMVADSAGGAPPEQPVSMVARKDDHVKPESTSPPEKAAPELPDVVADSVLDAIVMGHIRGKRPNRNSPRETGWLVRGNGERDLNGVFEDTGIGVGKAIPGGRDGSSVPFSWSPAKDDVRATVHTHPKSHSSVSSRRVNSQNASASDEDHDLVTIGRVPAYVYGTDGKVRVLERINGQIVERLLAGQDEELDYND